MSKPLKVISINFGFQGASVVCESGLDTQRSLFDFDVVVVRPHSLRPFICESSYTAEGKYYLGQGDYYRSVGVVSGKTRDLARLLAQGGVLVIILDAIEII